jgi:hypothetical protein
MISACDYTLPTLLDLTRVAADAARVACNQEDFWGSTVLQHSVASALCKTIEGLEIRVLRGFLCINGKKMQWPETITSVCLGDQWIGDGKVYTQEDIEAMVKKQCIEVEKDKIAAFAAATLTMEYSTLKGVIGMGMSSPELIDTVSNAIEIHQTQVQYDTLQQGTHPVEGSVRSRRI